jgi:hypothetical protein
MGQSPSAEEGSTKRETCRGREGGKQGEYSCFSKSILLLVARAGLTKIYLFFFINNRVLGVRVYNTMV